MVCMYVHQRIKVIENRIYKNILYSKIKCYVLTRARERLGLSPVHILFKLKNCMFHNFYKIDCAAPWDNWILTVQHLLGSTRTNFYGEKAFFDDGSISLGILAVRETMCVRLLLLFGRWQMVCSCNCQLFRLAVWTSPRTNCSTTCKIWANSAATPEGWWSRLANSAKRKIHFWVSSQFSTSVHAYLVEATTVFFSEFIRQVKMSWGGIKIARSWANSFDIDLTLSFVYSRIVTEILLRDCSWNVSRFNDVF